MMLSIIGEVIVPVSSLLASVSEAVAIEKKSELLRTISKDDVADGVLQSLDFSTTFVPNPAIANWIESKSETDKTEGIKIFMNRLLSINNNYEVSMVSTLTRQEVLRHIARRDLNKIKDDLLVQRLPESPVE